jgi:hypothetical protein
MSKHLLSCALPPSVSCYENSVILHEVFGRTLGVSGRESQGFAGTWDSAKRRRQNVPFRQADDWFPTPVVRYKGCCDREGAAPYYWLADILLNNVVSQNNVVWVRYDR